MPGDDVLERTCPACSEPVIPSDPVAFRSGHGLRCRPAGGAGSLEAPERREDRRQRARRTAQRLEDTARRIASRLRGAAGSPRAVGPRGPSGRGPANAAGRSRAAGRVRRERPGSVVARAR